MESLTCRPFSDDLVLEAIARVLHDSDEIVVSYLRRYKGVELFSVATEMAGTE